MTEKEQCVLEVLLDLERTIEAMPHATPKPNLLPLFARLDDLTRSLPSTTDPTLLHYLHKKSYQKARLFLEGREAENARGNCHGHVDERGHSWSADADAAGDPVPEGGGKLPPAP